MGNGAHASCRGKPWFYGGTPDMNALQRATEIVHATEIAHAANHTNAGPPQGCCQQ